MERDFDRELTLGSETFSDMNRDYNFILQRLLETMRERGCDEGTITLKMDVSLKSEYITNYDPKVQGESREIKKPKFEHKISSSVKITDEKKGTLDTEMELVMDEETGMFVLRPVINTAQRSLFDDDMRERFHGSMNAPEDMQGDAEEESGDPALPGRKVLGLPGSVDAIDGEFRELPESPDSGENGADDIYTEDDAENAPVDATSALFEDTEGPLPFGDEYGDDDDGYGYEEPGEE